jgi:hypothetical protein
LESPVVSKAPTPPTRVSKGAAFHTIGELAERCGQCCWVERRLFALTGARAGDPQAPRGSAEQADPEARVLLSEISFRHGLVASQWRERLPVRAGVGREGLIVAPPGPAAAALDLLEGEPSLPFVLAGLAEQFLPLLLEAYENHLAQASLVSEAPVRAVLDAAVGGQRREIRAVRAALPRLFAAADHSAALAEFGTRLQRVLGNGGNVFPAAWAS